MIGSDSSFNPHTPVAQKVADEVVFDVSKVLNRPSLTPSDFDAHLLENPNLSPSSFPLQWVLYQDHVLSLMVLQLNRTNEI